MANQTRKLHRLKNYDYGTYGFYYITICTFNREKILCHINNDFSTIVTPTHIGNIVTDYFYKIPLYNSGVRVDQFVLMPNHIHAILVIDNADENTENPQSLFQIERKGQRTLQGILRDYKSITTRYYKKLTCSKSPLWQSSFYDEVIKSQRHYDNVCKYIQENPDVWEKDELYI